MKKAILCITLVSALSFPLSMIAQDNKKKEEKKEQGTDSDKKEEAKEEKSNEEVKEGEKCKKDPLSNKTTCSD